MTISQKKWLMAGLVAFAAASGWLLLRRPSESVHEGRAVRYWFQEYCRSGSRMAYDPSRHEDAVAALRLLGTNAVPYLLQQSFSFPRASATQQQWYRLLVVWHQLWGKPPPVPPDIMQSESAMALKEMRPPASLLLAALEPHLKSTNSIGHPQALFILGTVGEGAEQVVPWLCAALKGPEGGERWLALQSLGWLGTNARSAVPALIGVLKEGEGTRRPPTPGAHAAAVALGAIGGAAAPALPLVRALFEQETNWNSRCTLAAAVCSIDAGQADAFAFLTNSLALHEPASERWGVVRALGNLGPNAKAAVPLLLAALDGTNDMVFAQVPRALKEMGVPVDTFLPRMRRQLQSRNETTRVNAAARLLELDPADREAVALLMSEIQRRAMFRDFALETLAYTAPRVPEVLPLLHDLAQHGSKQEREVARRALKRIESRTTSVRAVPLRP